MGKDSFVLKIRTSEAQRIGDEWDSGIGIWRERQRVDPGSNNSKKLS
jgi:hypothetical protein